MKRKILVLSFLLSTLFTHAQEPITQHPIREADKMWSLRIWREIDLRQKINQPLYYPRVPSQGYSSLYDVIINGIEQGDVAVFSTGPLGTESELVNPLSLDEIQTILVRHDTVSTPELESGDWVKIPVMDSVSTEKIKRYQIMEDWIFDKQRSMMVPRIRAIAPLKEVLGEDGELRGFTLLFWVDFEQLRPYLSASPVFLRQNDNHAISYDDLFMKRYFSARVVKESNVYDRAIHEYAQGVDALLEGERIEEKIRSFESDLWDY